MCSICGGEYPLEIVKKASNAMLHRGLDARGEFWFKNFSFAHNRLKIIDLDDNANQPFISPLCPHLVLIFNGEIYNYLEIKKELESKGVAFYTKSDTEVLLHAYFYFGESCLQKFNGDFAFCIFNSKDSTFFLARDRLGNKPLFYTQKNNKFFFASEIKAFLQLESFEIEKEQVAKWLLFGSGDIDKTLFSGILNFPPAHFATLKNNKLEFKKYWDFTPNFERIKTAPFNTESELEKLEFLLNDALKLRLRSDVPVALCVSGGIDSSTLAHLAVKNGVNCELFGINFKDNIKGDESKFLAQLQSDLGVKVHFLNPTLDTFENDFKEVLRAQDEITHSLSHYAQFLLFKEMSKTHKVVIGGQGADELFGGYYHHIGRFIYEHFSAFEDRLNIYGNDAFKEYQFGLKCALKDDLKLKLFAEDNEKGVKKLESLGFKAPDFDFLLKRFCASFSLGLWLDTICFNLPNLLRYEDRNAMYFTMENRTPFTDFRLVEFAFSINESLKFQKGFSKYILRLLLEKLGSKLAWRVDKIGFSVPEFALMQKLGKNCETLFDVRLEIFKGLK